MTCALAASALEPSEGSRMIYDSLQVLSSTYCECSGVLRWPRVFTVSVLEHSLGDKTTDVLISTCVVLLGTKRCRDDAFPAASLAAAAPLHLEEDRSSHPTSQHSVWLHSIKRAHARAVRACWTAARTHHQADCKLYSFACPSGIEDCNLVGKCIVQGRWCSICR